MSTSVLICGIGGQGTVLAAKVLSAAAVRQGLKVLSAETIGMAQRGGSVVSHVRMGEGIFSPLVPKGGADIMIAFDASEAVRNMDYLNKNSVVIVNSQVIQPVSASLSGKVFSSSDMICALRNCTAKVVDVDGSGICRELNSSKVLNMVLLGAALKEAEGLPLRDNILFALKSLVKPDFLELNQRALGY